MGKTDSLNAGEMPDISSYETILKRTEALCARREYCISDITPKLRNWGMDENQARQIIKTLLNERFIDEARYSKAFVRDKFRFNKWGRIKIGMLLKMKNIPPSIIKEALGTIDQDEYFKVIKNLIALKRKSIRGNSDYETGLKLMRFGLSKGFEKDVLIKVIGFYE